MNNKKVKIKEGKIFSFALFKQSVKAHKNIWLATTFGNCLVVAILIVVLSSINISATKTGLGNLFDTAQLEHTVKANASSTYMGYDMMTNSYYNDIETLSNVSTNVYSVDKKILDGYDIICNEKPISAGKPYGEYILDYYDNRSTGQTKEEKRTNCKLFIRPIIERAVDAETADFFTNYFLDPYLIAHDPDTGSKNNDVYYLAKYAFSMSIDSYIDDAYPDFVPYKTNIVNMVNLSIDAYSPGSKGEDEKIRISYENMLNTILTILPSSISTDTVSKACNVFMYGADDIYEMKNPKTPQGQTIFINGYIKDPSNYNGNSPYLKAYAMLSISAAMFQDNSKWDYFPSFEVKYVTNEAGIPIDKDGMALFSLSEYPLLSKDYVPMTKDGKELNITTELLAKRIKVKNNMGTSSDNLQKQYRALLDERKVEQLNGKDISEYPEGEKNTVKSKYIGYTASEIRKAEEDLNKADLVTKSKSILASFMKKLILDDKDNTSIYYDKTNKKINKDKLIEEVADTLTEQATPIILDQFEIESLSDLTVEKNGISGEELLYKVKEYSSFAISSYELLIQRYQGYYVDEDKTVRKYTDTQCQNMAIVKSGIGSVDMLPVYITGNLTDLSSINMYGLVIGIIFFDCAGILLSIIYLMMTANELIAGQVDSGSLAFVLSTPTKRSKFAFTQVIYLFTSLLVSYIIIFAVALAAREMGIAWLHSEDLKTELSRMHILYYSIGSFAVSFAIAGICLLSSCIFNKSKISLGIGMGISMFFLVVSIIGIFGTSVMPQMIRIDAMSIFNYLTIVRLFDVNSVLTNNMSDFWIKLSGLFAIGIVTTVAGCIYFEKKDLPL